MSWSTDRRRHRSRLRDALEVMFLLVVFFGTLLAFSIDGFR